MLAPDAKHQGIARLTSFLSARFLLPLAGFLILCGLYVLFVWTLPLPRIFVVLAAKSESLAYRVINSDFAAMHIVGMKAASVDGAINHCLDAIVTPTLGTRVEYRRGDDDTFVITLDPAEPNAISASLPEGTSAAKLRELKGSVVFTASKACGDTTPKRLPIWGLAEFGEEMHPPGLTGDIAPGLLTEGTLSVYGHAHDRLLGFKFPSIVYLVTSFDLPAGAVLAAKEPDGRLSASPWTGIARVLSDETGFDVAATTEARTVSMTSARIEGDGRESAQRVDLGDFSQFMNDPNLIQIQVLGGIFLFLLQGFAGMSGFFARHWRQKENGRQK
jgi:hypothetical protein